MPEIETTTEHRHEFPRTEEGFARVYQNAMWFVHFHRKPVWLIALTDQYIISVVRPEPQWIASGTMAVQYDENGREIDTVQAEDL